MLPTATYDPESSDSPLDAALFLSFEEWKKRNLEKVGQSPEHVGSSGRKGAGGVGSKKGGGAATGAGAGRKGPGNNIHNALDALGDDVEIEWGGYNGGDDGKIEDGKGQVAEHKRKGSRADGVAADPESGNNHARRVDDADPASEDAAFQTLPASTPQASTSTRGSSGREAGKTCKERFNYASFDCGATVLKTNAEGKNPSAVLVEHKDSYMLNECGAKGTKFLIVELCADILVDTVVLANYEFFSSMIRVFRVSVSDRYPPPLPPSPQVLDGTDVEAIDGKSEPDSHASSAKDSNAKKAGDTEGNPDKSNGIGKRVSDGWRELGIFEARNSRGIQAFAIENPLVWARYLRLEFLSHYGSEFYCPVSLLRVHGTTMMEEFRYQQEESEEDGGEGDGEEEGNVEGNAENVEADDAAVQAEVDTDVSMNNSTNNVDDIHQGEGLNGTDAKNEDEGSNNDVVLGTGPESATASEPLASSAEGQLQSDDTLALATMYGNLSIDQLLGLVEEHFKGVEHDESNAGSDDVRRAPGTSESGAGVGSGTAVTVTMPVTTVPTTNDTASATVITSKSGNLEDINIISNDISENIKDYTDVDADTSSTHHEIDRATSTVANGGDSVTLISNSTASANTSGCESSRSQAGSAMDGAVSPESSTHAKSSPSKSTSVADSINHTSSSSYSTQQSISSHYQPSSSSSSLSSSASSSASSPSSSTAAITSSPTRPPPPNPTTQESFFKTVHKRLQMLESNSTLSLQYIEDQSRILRDAFLKVEKRQSIKIDEYLATLSRNITEEVERYVSKPYFSLWYKDMSEFRCRRLLTDYYCCSASNMISSGS